MKRGNLWALCLQGLAGMVLLSGCAAVCGVEQESAALPPPPKKWEGAPAPASEAPATAPALPTTYVVDRCDDLWSIAARPEIYHNPWLWPLLWQANRDKIRNPNRIKEGWVLQVPRDVSDGQKAEARKKARKFPKYVPPKGAKRYCPPK